MGSEPMIQKLPDARTAADTPMMSAAWLTDIFDSFSDNRSFSAMRSASQRVAVSSSARGTTRLTSPSFSAVAHR